MEKNPQRRKARANIEMLLASQDLSRGLFKRLLWWDFVVNGLGFVELLEFLFVLKKKALKTFSGENTGLVRKNQEKGERDGRGTQPPAARRAGVRSCVAAKPPPRSGHYVSRVPAAHRRRGQPRGSSPPADRTRQNH